MTRVKLPPTPDQVAATFETFAVGGYPWAKFTDGLYRALHCAFGFIAHFDRGGFYQVRFVDLDGRVETLEVMAHPEAWCRDRPMERALREIVERRDLHMEAVRARDAAVIAAERAELARLKAKYEDVDPLS